MFQVGRTAGVRRWGGAISIICMAALLHRAGGKSFAELFCEKNDCDGAKASATSRSERQALERRIERLQRRYLSTGEVVALVPSSIEFRYEEHAVDDPAYPGMATRNADRAELHNDRAAAKARRRRAHRPHPPAADRGGEDVRAEIARRWFKMHVVSEVRIGCKYDNIIPRRASNFSWLPYGSPWGCAAGSVWIPDEAGSVMIDHGNILHKTEEFDASVWRMVNGSDIEWFEHPRHHYTHVDEEDGRLAQGPIDWHTTEARRILPLKRFAPPPCSPGYGGAGCRREIGAGGDYVDEEDEVPRWMLPADAERLMAFWRSALQRHAAIAAAAGRPVPHGDADPLPGGYACSPGGTRADGPWHGGWWAEVGWGGGEKAGSPGDIREITVGGVRCKREVWLSPSSALCMLSRGHGHSLPVAVSLNGFPLRLVEGANVTFLPPEVHRIHPKTGPARGGALVTIHGARFGAVDSRPAVSLGGRVCMETFSEGDSRILCRTPPGWGSVEGFVHTVNVRFEDSAPQSLPLPAPAREALLAAKETLLEHYMGVAESCNANGGSRGLVEEMRDAAERENAKAILGLVTEAVEQQAREQEARRAREQAIENARRRKATLEVEAGSGAGEVRDPAEIQEERRQEEEKAAAAAKRRKFEDAKRKGLEAKARAKAKAAITGGGAGAATALGALRNAEVPLGDETVQKLQEILGLPPGYEAAEDKPGALEAKDGSAEDIAGKEAAGAAKGQEGGIADGAEGGDEELPELDVYEEGAVEGPTKAKRRKGKKGKKKKQNLS